MQASRTIGNFAVWCGLTTALCVAVVVALIVRADRKSEPLPIIGEIYNSYTDELSAYVYATNAQHRFPNGKIEEGWLTRPVDVPGALPPVWTVKPHKARVVWR